MIKRHIMTNEATKLQQIKNIVSMSKKEVEALKDIEINESEFESFMHFGEDESDSLLISTKLHSMFSRFIDDDEQEEHLHDVETSEDKLDVHEGEDEELAKASGWDVSRESIETAMAMFTDQHPDDERQDLANFEMMRLMPKENQFWADLVSVVKAERDGPKIIEAICKDSSPDKGLSLLSHAAFFMSLVAKQNLFHDAVADLPQDVESSVSMSTREIDKDDENFVIVQQTLQKKISDLLNAIPNTEGYVKELLTKKLNDLQLQLDAYETEAEKHEAVEVSYYEYMAELLVQLAKENMFNASDKTHELESQSVMLISHVLSVAIELNKFHQVSDSDLASMRIRMWDRVFTPAFNRYISIGLRCYIEVRKNGQRVCAHMPGFPEKHIIVDLG